MKVVPHPYIVAWCAKERPGVGLPAMFVCSRMWVGHATDDLRNHSFVVLADVVVELEDVFNIGEELHLARDLDLDFFGWHATKLLDVAHAHLHSHSSARTRDARRQRRERRAAPTLSKRRCSLPGPLYVGFPGGGLQRAK